MQTIEDDLTALQTMMQIGTSRNVRGRSGPTPMTTLMERIQVLESKVNNLEPSLSTLQSSISSTPLDPPEGMRKGDGSINDHSSTHLLPQEQALHKRIETLEAWVTRVHGTTMMYAHETTQ